MIQTLSSNFRYALKMTTSLQEVEDLERKMTQDLYILSSLLYHEISVRVLPQSHCRRSDLAYWGASPYSLMRLLRALLSTTCQIRHDVSPAFLSRANAANVANITSSLSSKGTDTLVHTEILGLISTSGIERVNFSTEYLEHSALGY